MEEVALKATSRTAMGHKCKALRRQGMTPVHVFGHNIESLALQCDTLELQKVITRAGRTTLIDLKIDGTKSPRKVLLRELQRRSGNLLHVDFYQVKLTEKLSVEVPIVLVGEAPAVKSQDTMILQDLSSITVECLPTKIPENVEIDISSLEGLGQAILVKDIKLGEGVTAVTDPDQILVKASGRAAEEVVAPAEEEVPAEEAAEAKAEEPAEAAPEAEGGESSSGE